MFAADVSADAPARAAPVDGPVSPSLPLPQSVMSATGLAPAPAVSPAYVLLWVRPDFDGTQEDHCSLSTSSDLPDGRLSPVSPAPPRSLSTIYSERSDDSFHSAADSPAIRTPIPDTGPVLAPSLFCEGLFDAEAHHPRIWDQHGGCPYRVTSYRDYKHYIKDGQFGMQVHHPQFLEWVGARLLGRAPGEWVRSLTRVQTLDRS